MAPATASTTTTAPVRLVEPCGPCAQRRVSLCAALDDAFLDRLAAIVTTIDLAPRQTLLMEEDPARYYFNVTAGTLKVYKLLQDGRQQIVGFLLPGDFLGLAIRNNYAYSAEAVTAATVCRFPRARLEELLRAFPRLEARLRSIASNELAVAQEQMLALGRKSARERLATFLVQLSRRAERVGLPADPITLPMTRQDIADYMGLTIETVSRAFTLLKTTGVIRLARQDRVEVAAPDRLRAIADGRG